MKIAVLGHSGSGKSTIAGKLSELYKIPVLYLDTVHFLPEWVERDRDECRKIVADFMQNESWVIDGNYRGFYQAERLEQADKIIILLFPRIKSLYRVISRYFKNINKSREDRAEGCDEKLDLQFIWWILHKGRDKARVKHYYGIFTEYQRKAVLLKSQKQVDEYVKHLVDEKHR